MAGFFAAARRHEVSTSRDFRAAGARSEKLKLTRWARSQFSSPVVRISAYDCLRSLIAWQAAIPTS